MRWIGRAWIAYKYRQYDGATSEANEEALRARHASVKGGYALALAAAIIVFLACALWFDLAAPLIERVRGLLH